MQKTLALIAAVIVLIAVAIPGVGAQDCPTSTLTVSEAQINDSFYVNNPINRNVTNAHVDLQAGQVVLSATYTWRTGRGVQTSADVVEVVTPSLSDGRVYWNVVSITVNGQPASSEMINQINAHLDASWYRWISQQAPAGVVTAITITDNDVTYTYSTCRSTSGGSDSSGSTSDDNDASATPVSSTSGSITITETQINDSFYVTNPINRRVSDANVDLQAASGGQVVLMATYEWRSGTGVQTADVVEVVTPSVSNGRVYWNVVSVTINGQPASSDLVNQINAHLDASWIRWISQQAPAGRVDSVTITDTDITYSY